MKWTVEFVCACGVRWRLTVPKKLRTQEFFEYAKAAWEKRHGGHVHKINLARPTAAE